MIISRSLTSIRLARHVRIARYQPKRLRKDIRSSSTAAGSQTWPASATLSPASPLAAIITELDKLAPRFDVQADSIEILKSPVDFYAALKTRIRRARRRIYLSTLYVGKLEDELIETLREALKANTDLKVSILTDYLRGTREAPEPSCASLLVSLVADFGSDRVDVRMYHTPNLTGLRKAVLPKRINEGWGLQHMKLYGIDDEIIMSGANLSRDYFTNRQDRYHIFKSKDITDYFQKVYHTTCRLSYQLRPSHQDPRGFVLDWPCQNLHPAPLENADAYISTATAALAPFTNPAAAQSIKSSASDVTVYPLLQLTPLLNPDTSNELPVLVSVFRKLRTPELAGSHWTFTAGYFNMTPTVLKLLLQSNPSSATVIAASPWANGFYGSKGISGMLPAAYTLLSRRFLDAVSHTGLSKRITLKEWRRGTVSTSGGWTYHAKGIWITLPGEHHPSISLVGSSNYTKRSHSLDLEANCLIVTHNEDLQKRLGEEERWLQEYALPVTLDDYAKNERRVGLHVRIAMWIVTLVGGAL